MSTFIWKIACPSCFIIFKKKSKFILTVSYKWFFSIQTLKSMSNFSNVKRKISEIWRDGRKKAGRNGKRETVGDRREGEGDGGGAKSPGETEKEILIKTRKGSPQKTKKEDRKSRKRWGWKKRIKGDLDEKERPVLRRLLKV